MWHWETLERIISILRANEGARALVLVGSLNNNPDLVDEWSDIDLVLVVLDEDKPRWMESTSWFEGVQKPLFTSGLDFPHGKLHEIYLDGYRRVEFLVISESALKGGQPWSENPLTGGYRILFSHIADLESIIGRIPSPGKPQSPLPGVVEKMSERFWPRAVIAVKKVMRNDLLIAQHLAFQLARDCLVLQMIRRDRHFDTNIHRTGGWGNDILDELGKDGISNNQRAVISVIDRYCRVFESMAKICGERYTERYLVFSMFLKDAQRQL